MIDKKTQQKVPSDILKLMVHFPCLSGSGPPNNNKLTKETFKTFSNLWTVCFVIRIWLLDPVITQYILQDSKVLANWIFSGWSGAETDCTAQVALPIAHHNPHLVYFLISFFPSVYNQEHLILQTIYVLNKEIL